MNAASPSLETGAGPGLRWIGALLAGVLLVFLLFLAMALVIHQPEPAPGDSLTLLEDIEVVAVEPPSERPPPEPFRPDSAPPPPPSAPPSLARAALPAVSLPSFSAPAAIGSVSVPLSLGGGLSLGGSGSFGGFAGGGGGSGGGGFGKGQGFVGKPLIPLSTARPQMPEWACKQKIKGWVEVVFTVLQSGRVQDVKIVDALPRGVYEAAAIESVANWIYEPSDRAREVKQRVLMDPADCAYNWQ
ncbi:MAG TPA: TonB family protein [Nevskiaceae bacterium]|nr:TonB family protein [Nevskiaceae bacterium]